MQGVEIVARPARAVRLVWNAKAALVEAGSRVWYDAELPPASERRRWRGEGRAAAMDFATPLACRLEFVPRKCCATARLTRGILLSIDDFASAPARVALVICTHGRGECRRHGRWRIGLGRRRWRLRVRPAQSGILGSIPEAHAGGITIHVVEKGLAVSAPTVCTTKHVQDDFDERGPRPVLRHQVRVRFGQLVPCIHRHHRLGPEGPIPGGYAEDGVCHEIRIRRLKVRVEVCRRRDLDFALCDAAPVVW